MTSATDTPVRRPVALITGASRGIGRAIADELAADFHLLLGGRDREALSTLAARYPSAAPFPADLTDPEATADATGALELPDGLAALVHSAGTLVSGRIDELAAKDWTRSLTTNVAAVGDLTRQLLPALRRARGTVVAINSGSGFTAGAGGGAYSASKFALRALTDALRQEESPHGVRVTSIHPGRVDTDMQHQLRDYESGEYQAQHYLRPASVAAAVAFAVRAPAEASIDSLSIRPR